MWIESTDDFADALSRAYDKTRIEAIAGLRKGRRESPAVGYILKRERRQQLRAAHREVRRLYLQKQGKRFAWRVDWSKLVNWLIENWDEILKIVVTILPLVI